MIDKNLVLLNVQADSAQKAIEILVTQAYKQERVSSISEVVHAVLEREKEGTTGFGGGIAIPHGKSNDVKEPTLMFATLASGIDWQSLDEKPVDKLFLILVPEVSHSDHLQILAKLARKLMHDDFVNQLQAIHNVNELTSFIQSELA